MESYSQLLRAGFLTARYETWSSGCSGTRGGGGGGCSGAAGGGSGDAAPRPEFEPDDDARRPTTTLHLRLPEGRPILFGFWCWWALANLERCGRVYD